MLFLLIIIINMYISLSLYIYIYIHIIYNTIKRDNSLLRRIGTLTPLPVATLTQLAPAFNSYQDIHICVYIYIYIYIYRRYAYMYVDMYV